MQYSLITVLFVAAANAQSTSGSASRTDSAVTSMPTDSMDSNTSVPDMESNNGTLTNSGSVTSFAVVGSQLVLGAFAVMVVL